jgi:uncharacterized protein YkwD
MRRFALVLSAFAVLAFAGANAALADSVGPITFEFPPYVVGDINGQDGWMKLNPLYDVKVALVSTYPAAAGYGFGRQALRLSDAYTQGSFGDQTFSPGLAEPAGEAPGLQPHFDAGFRIGTTKTTVQPGSHFSVSPDDGSGGRMSYLRFEDQNDGVHVFFDDVQQPGLCLFPGCANFVETDIATLSRTRSHSIRFSIDFKPGPGNDVVRIYIDGTRRWTGTTWEDYYRYDPEAAAHLGQPPPVRKLIFRESGLPDPTNLGQGFLVDYVYLASSTPSENCGRNDDSDRAERDAVNHMNQQRAAAFLPPLTMNTASSDAARKHSCDMHDHGHKGEQGSDGSMSADRMNAAGVPFLVNAENDGLATDLAAADGLSSIESSLLGEASSKANILNPAFTQVGVGAVYLDGELWLTEDFTG